MNNKTCNQCLDCKPLERFYYCKRSQGHLSICRDCTLINQRAWRKTKGGQVSQKAHYQSRKARGLTSRPYTKKTPAERKTAVDAVRRWRAKNREAFNAESRQCMFIRRSPAYQAAWPIIVAHYGNVCQCCGSTKVIFDHVQPLSQGGPNRLTNGQPLCRKCNTFKACTDASKDHRPDKGEWIRALVMANPWLEWQTEAGKRWPMMNGEERSKWTEIKELARRGLVMPVQDAQRSGGEVGFHATAVAICANDPRQDAQRRLLDTLIANLPQE